MSYCRFSTDDHTSDVYVYESDQGFEVMVASNRRVLTEPLPRVDVRELSDVDFDAAKAGNEVEQAKIDDWLARGKERSRVLDEAELVPIGGSYDGAQFTYDEPGRATSALRHLRASGYHVPAGVIESLDSEQDDIEAAAMKARS